MLVLNLKIKTMAHFTQRVSSFLNKSPKNSHLFPQDLIDLADFPTENQSKNDHGDTLIGARSTEPVHQSDDLMQKPSSETKNRRKIPKIKNDQSMEQKETMVGLNINKSISCHILDEENPGVDPEYSGPNSVLKEFFGLHNFKISKRP